MSLTDTQLQDRRRRYALYEDRKKSERVGDHGCTAPTGASDAAPGIAKKKLFSEVPSIRGTRITLDRVVDGDARDLLDLIGNPLVQRYEPAYLFEKQRSDIHETIRLLYGDLFASRESLILAIRLNRTGELAGLAEFYGLRDRLHKISIGYRLRERFWGRGLATEAARLMVGYLYGETDIETITASTMIENVASARVLQKADFIRTARGVGEDWGFAEPTIVDKWFC
ncbi:MAG: GNAT family N-acetyltransferase [Eggerthellaceae bacterium]|nr:GNAT family N-acetyltransferase [Eggerthellaceae bacterium]